MNKRDRLILPVRHQKDAPFAERFADHATAHIGTMHFLLFQLGFFCVWVVINTLTLFGYLHFDPFPFILLNLVVGIESACTGPLVMMSQNRQEAKDRLMAEQTFSDTEILKQNHALLIAELHGIRTLLEREREA